MKPSTFWLSLAIALALPAGVTMAGPAPDAPQAPMASRWMFIPASSFVTRDSDSSYSYSSGGCLSAPTGVMLTHKLVPPNGATLRYLRLYYRDNSGAGALTGYVTSYNAQGNLSDITSVRSANRPGYSSSLSPDINHVVDRTAQNYAINVRFELDGDSIFLNGFESSTPPLLFCGVRMMWDE